MKPNGTMEFFSMRRFYRGYVKAAIRESSLVIVGDCVMEPIQLVHSGRGTVSHRQILHLVW